MEDDFENSHSPARHYAEEICRAAFQRRLEALRRKSSLMQELFDAETPEEHISLPLLASESTKPAFTFQKPSFSGRGHQKIEAVHEPIEMEDCDKNMSPVTLKKIKLESEPVKANNYMSYDSRPANNSNLDSLAWECIPVIESSSSTYYRYDQQSDEYSDISDEEIDVVTLSNEPRGTYRRYGNLESFNGGRTQDRVQFILPNRPREFSVEGKDQCVQQAPLDLSMKRLPSVSSSSHSELANCPLRTDPPDLLDVVPALHQYPRYPLSAPGSIRSSGQHSASSSSVHEPVHACISVVPARLPSALHPDSLAGAPSSHTTFNREPSSAAFAAPHVGSWFLPGSIMSSRPHSTGYNFLMERPRPFLLTEGGQ